MDLRLDGMVAIVTGGFRGIGEGSDGGMTHGLAPDPGAAGP
jgi:hypothetical protein